LKTVEVINILLEGKLSTGHVDGFEMVFLSDRSEKDIKSSMSVFYNRNKSVPPFVRGCVSVGVLLAFVAGAEVEGYPELASGAGGLFRVAGGEDTEQGYAGFVDEGTEGDGVSGNEGAKGLEGDFEEVGGVEKG
jgi:hypothetical protein